MNFAFIFAMEEEAVVINKIFSNITSLDMQNNSSCKILQYKHNNLTFTIMISGIGKVSAALATALLIEKYNADIIVNIGTAGGINCKIGDIVISNQAMYHDVDVSAFGYLKGQIPHQPLVFQSTEKVLNLNKLINTNLADNNIITGCIATGDQFINDINIVNNIKNSYKNVRALEMEAAAIAQVCYYYNKEFIFIKKISDLADSTAKESFKQVINNFNINITEIVKNLIKYYINFTN